ncbi:MAG TPA: heterodisulfide reductase-related iron-sulfur binding cluster [Anaerolineales bacterium]|nr:heterodisulfide reductase-related iron-sulfur binding cluster [Anaerolineales bacterium]|tara:strand:- start:4827 stop:6083 length:1257 start_codon:yes stop_codon:yes gene_type:complete
MQHNIPVDRLGPNGSAMASAVKSCVHCGFCLPACPTYQVLGQEMDSPRGRILLMKNVLEGTLSVQEAQPFVDRCLGCMACTTACPPDVPYGDLLILFRSYAENNRANGSILDTWLRQIVLEIMPYPARFRAAMLLGMFARSFKAVLPKKLATILDLLPSDVPTSNHIPDIIPAIGRKRARVALMQGCVQSVLAPAINEATVRVLSKNGVEVVIPRGQGCCGALTLHSGSLEKSRKLALRNLRVFPTDVDAVLTTAAGCGSGISEYEMLFNSTDDLTIARDFANRVQDVTVFLDELGLSHLPGPINLKKVAYHDACHLSHAQGVRDAPRRLMEQVPDVEVVNPSDGETCCGSAGIYNIEQPEIAEQLGARKAAKVIETGASVLVTTNIGCITQIESHLRVMNNKMPVMHVMEMLDNSYE